MRPADGDRDPEIADRLRRHRGAQPLGRAAGAGTIRRGLDDDELVAAPAGELVAAADGLGEPPGHLGQDLVAALVAVVVVDLLEVVDVDPRERQVVAVAHGERDGAVELVRPVAAVREAREVVGERLLGEPPVGVDERVVELLHPQGGGHARLELRGVERLAQVVVRPRAQRGEQQRLLVLGGRA